MKKFRFLMALVVVVTMLTTVAMACADESLDGYGIGAPATATYADGVVSFDLTMISPEETSYDFCQINVKYDANYTVELLNVATGFDIKKVDNGLITLGASTGGTFANNATLVTIKATAAELPADPNFVISKVDFWGDDDYIYCECDCGEGYKTVTVTAAGGNDPVAPTYTEGKAAKVTLNGASGEVYTGIWSNDYTVTLNDNVANFVKLAITGKGADEVEATKDFAITSNTAGEGTIAFKVAVFGLVSGNGVPSIAETEGEWVAAELAE